MEDNVRQACGFCYAGFCMDWIINVSKIKISYFKAVYEGLLECETKVINKGKSIASLESTITNGDNLVAKASGTYSIFEPRKKT